MVSRYARIYVFQRDSGFKRATLYRIINETIDFVRTQNEIYVSRFIDLISRYYCTFFTSFILLITVVRKNL